MPTTGPEAQPPESAQPDARQAGSRQAGERLPVAVGVLRRRDNRVLIQRRPPGRPCAGQWEFPGGKVETGESPRDALARELGEELGVDIATKTGAPAPPVRPLMELPFDYAHARVRLAVFLLDGFDGEAVGREGQHTRWLTTAEIRQLDILAAVHPILDALERLEAADHRRITLGATDNRQAASPE